jgi:serine/threonine-protein kinase RsbT
MRKEEEKLVIIGRDGDLVEARLAARKMAQLIGFTGGDLVAIAAAVSEVARNIIEYAGSGEIVLFPVYGGSRSGLGVIAHDSGPGIPDVTQAMQEGYSTSRGLGLGLPGARRLMDEFEIVSTVGRGTTVKMRKWQRQQGNIAA